MRHKVIRTYITFYAVKDGYLECHFYLGDSGASRVLKSRSRVDDGSRHRVVISKLNVSPVDHANFFPWN